jgi:lipopolysaccharide/colanic/teichoic acid biosynthesis glycosyltransferase
VISFFNQKFKIDGTKKFILVVYKIIRINIVILALAVLGLYAFRELDYSRFIVFGSIGIATIIELFYANLNYLLVNSKYGQDSLLAPPKIATAFKEKRNRTKKDRIYEKPPQFTGNIKNAIINEAGQEVFNLIRKYIDLSKDDYTILSTTTRFNIERLPYDYYNSLVNLKRINDIRYINKFFESVNSKLHKKGILIGCAETKNQRKHRILKKYPPIINATFYFLDYIVKRIFPKFFITKKIYFFLTRGENRVISKAEIFGRLYSCGFEVIDDAVISGHLFFVSKKIKQPYFDDSPTYGPFIKLKRVGKDGKIINVYKLRTMHPFAEYLQDYVYKKGNLKEGGKFDGDFRITTIGKFLRKVWLDETPMLINIIKGDMKLIGVRPLSQHYFSLYSKELQEKRTRFKPGLFPPYYADMPKNLEEIEASEFKYLNEYEKHHFRTDFKYFWKVVYNIVWRKKRSS